MSTVPSIEFMRRLAAPRLPVRLDDLAAATDRHRAEWAHVRSILRDRESIIAASRRVGWSTSRAPARTIPGKLRLFSGHGR